MQPIHGKIISIDRKELANPFAFGGAQECCIGKLHASIAIFAHQFTYPWNIIGIERENSNSAPQDRFPDRILARGQIV